MKKQIKRIKYANKPSRFFTEKQIKPKVVKAWAIYYGKTDEIVKHYLPDEITPLPRIYFNELGAKERVALNCSGGEVIPILLTPIKKK